MQEEASRPKRRVLSVASEASEASVTRDFDSRVRLASQELSHNQPAEFGLGIPFLLPFLALSAVNSGSRSDHTNHKRYRRH
jgi:hypothetical protein